MTAKLIFWISVGLIFYVYAGYPVLLWLMQIFFRQPWRNEEFEPSVSLIIAAYNEADVIAAKVRNTLALDYTSDRLEIVFASDGSTDDTAKIVRHLLQAAGNQRARLVEFPENRGKLTVLNECIPQLRGEIIVFSDASSLLASDSLRALTADFADSRVGAVSGVYKVLNKDRAALGRQEDFYWKYETFLKTQEAKIGGLTGAHGSLYAIRHSLYPFPPINTINDDFVIPTSVLHRGFRIAYEPRAVASEEAHEMEGFGRRIRIMAGNVEQLREIKGLLWPPRLVALFCFLSHKAGRVVVPLAMLALALSSPFLWRAPLYQWIVWGQILFYVLAILGALRLKPRVLRLPFYFCMINASLFVWLYRVVTGRGRPESRDPKRPHVAWT
jgi:cellulose synthase/poly-beta-1,6-N-acetylglucosamine synthase-like glycosyltransferase